MEALQRDVLSNNWLAIIFVSSLVLLFFLKLYTATKLKGYAMSIFNKGFVEIESEDIYARFSIFHLVFSVFSFLMVSVSIYFIIHEHRQNSVFLFLDYLEISYYVSIFMIFRFVLEVLLVKLFETKETLSHFLLSKTSYLYSISIGLLILNIWYFYSFQNQYFLILGFTTLFLVRLLVILINNKNLIIKELFYFILYLCAFELAPLFVLFKSIF
tara:strand:- start:9859 stop:10500 length:642 start_codon:yes stop_codon:yes gene_type:complete